MSQRPRPHLPALDARETVLLIGLCEWLIDTLWCTLDAVDVVDGASSSDRSDPIDAHAPGTAPVDDDSDPF